MTYFFTLMLCLSGSRSYSKSTITLRSKFFAIAGCTISHSWPPIFTKIFLAIAGRTGCTEHFLQLATNKFLMSISSELEFQSHHFYNVSNIEILSKNFQCNEFFFDQKALQQFLPSFSLVCPGTKSSSNYCQVKPQFRG